MLDISKWFGEFLDDKLLSAESRAAILATAKTDVGFGWDEKGFDRRFNETLYLSSGRSPGFSSVILYLPNEGVTVIVLANVEHALDVLIGENIASIVVGTPHKPFADSPVSLTMQQRQQLTGRFTFGPDFYRPNATLALRNTAQSLALEWAGRARRPSAADRREHVHRSLLLDPKDGRPRLGRSTARTYAWNVPGNFRVAALTMRFLVSVFLPLFSWHIFKTRGRHFERGHGIRRRRTGVWAGGGVWLYARNVEKS